MYSYHSFLDFKSVICLSEKRRASDKNFLSEELLASILPEFGNSSTRLNFTASPPRDIRGNVENFYLQVK